MPNRIPGVSGKRLPSGKRLRLPHDTGNFKTNVPFQAGGSSIFREYHFQQVRDTRGRFAGGWGFAWQGLEGINASVIELNDDIHQNIRRGAEALKDEMVTYMKTHAPWEDESGEARRELQGVVVWEDDEHFTIMLGHGKDIYYGIWLEVRFGGRYAIILPTIRKFAPVMGQKIVSAT